MRILTQKQSLMGRVLCCQGIPQPFLALISQRQDPLGYILPLELTLYSSTTQPYVMGGAHWKCLAHSLGIYLLGYSHIVRQGGDGDSAQPGASCFPMLFS